MSTESMAIPRSVPRVDGQPVVMFVDDDPEITATFRRNFGREPYAVITANSAQEALGILDRESITIVVSDEHMPEMPGSEFLSIVRRRHPDTLRMILTGQASVETAIQAVNEGGIFKYLTKPCRTDELVTHIRQALAVAASRRGTAAANDDGHAVQLARFQRATEQLWMAVQPVVSLREHRAYAYESLVRTTEPSVPHGGAFVELAESVDRMGDLERQIRRAVAAIAPNVPDDSLLFVNVHPASLDDPELYAPDAPLAPYASRIVLELTERVALHTVSAVVQRVAALREQGYRIAIDDLGAGYAGLGTLALLHPEIVKLDMCLVRDIDTIHTKARLVEAMVTLCKDLGILVVAEGVETVAELDTLQSLGCDLIQGYLLARPGKPFPSLRWPESYALR